MPLSLTTAEQIFSMVTSVIPMVFGKKINSLSAGYTNILRGLFVAVILFQIGCYIYIKYQIAAVNNQTRFKYKKANPMSEEEIEISVFDYDMEDCNKAVKSLLLGAGISLFIHWKFKGIQPIVSQILGVFKPLLFSGSLREYIYHQKLQRPWEKNYLYGSVTVEDVVEIKEDEDRKEVVKKTIKSNMDTSDREKKESKPKRKED